MSEKELWKQAQKDVVEIEWWKDKFFKILDAECSNRVVSFHFPKDDAKKIFDEFLKWRFQRSKVSDGEVEG